MIDIVDESVFNRLSRFDRLQYILDRFHIGMDVCINVGKNLRHPEEYGKVFGFYDYCVSDYNYEIKKHENAELVIPEPLSQMSHYKSYNVMPDKDEEDLPLCNIFVLTKKSIIVGNRSIERSVVTGYYPLWVTPDKQKIRSNRLEIIGI